MVRKALILAMVLGKRILPAAKSMPKRCYHRNKPFIQPALKKLLSYYFAYRMGAIIITGEYNDK